MFAPKVHNEMQVPADIAVSPVVAVLDIAEEEERILSKEQVFDLACCFARLNQAKELMKRYLNSSLGVDTIIDYISSLNTAYDNGDIKTRLHKATLDFVEVFGYLPDAEGFETCERLASLSQDVRKAVVKTAKDTNQYVVT